MKRKLDEHGADKVSTPTLKSDFRCVKASLTPTARPLEKQGLLELDGATPKQSQLWSEIRHNVMEAMKPGGYLSARVQGGGGSFSKSQIAVRQALLSVFMSERILSLGLKTLFKTELHCSVGSIDAALELKRSHESAPDKQLVLAPERATRKNASDASWIRQYYHEHSDLIELDKTKTYIYTGRKTQRVPNRKSSAFTLEGCRPMRMRASPLECAQEMVGSKAYKEHCKATGRAPISAHWAQRYLCPCMSPAEVKEGVCKICTGFELLLEAWRRHHASIHTAASCSHVQCKREFSRYRRRMESVQEFLDSTLCQREHRTDLVGCPALHKLECCTYQRGNVRYPKHIAEPCRACGWDIAMLTPVAGTWQPLCDLDFDTGEIVRWKEYRVIEIQGKCTADGKARTKEVIFPVCGTRFDLMGKIQDKFQQLRFHVWVKRYTAAVESAVISSLSAARKEIAIKMDFAAQMELGPAQRATCERPSTCNLFVATVMYFNGGGARKVDYWRVWTDAKKTPEFVWLVLGWVFDRYRPQTAHIFTDGCTSEFKCDRNWMQVALASKQHAVHVRHYFTASYHFCCVVDSIGKDPRIAIQRAEKEEASEKHGRIYDYHLCYQWCKEHMKTRARAPARAPGAASWACTGEYIWRAVSAPGGPHAGTYPVPPPRRESNAITDSWLGVFAVATGPPSAPAAGEEVIHAWFVVCICNGCMEAEPRQRPVAQCRNSERLTGGTRTEYLKYKASAEQRETRATTRRAAQARREQRQRQRREQRRERRRLSRPACTVLPASRLTEAFLKTWCEVADSAERPGGNSSPGC